MTDLPSWLLEPQQRKDGTPLQEELNNITRELRQAEDIFNNVTDDALTEASIYRIKALLAYRDYLLRTARDDKERLKTTQKAAVPI